MHLHRREVGEDVRHRLQLGPVELDVLAGGEVSVALVVLAGNVGQHAQLFGRQQPVGDAHPQHRRKALHIQAVAKPQVAELVGRKLAGQIPSRLVAEFGDPSLNSCLILLVVAIH